MNKISLEALWSAIDPPTYLAEHIEALQNQNEALISTLRTHKLHEETCSWNETENEPQYNHEGFPIGFLTIRPYDCDCILKEDK